MRARTALRIIFALAVVGPAIVAGVPSGAASGGGVANSGVVSYSEVKHDASPPLTTLIARPAQVPESAARHAAVSRLVGPELPGTAQPAAVDDPSLQTGAGPGHMPATALNFEGINPDRWVPPDTNGDVGLSNYVESVNTDVGIYDKSGNLQPGTPFHANALFDGFGGPCEVRNDGDPIIQYDALADRWVFTQFALPGSPWWKPPFYQCFAVSQTADPTGSWYRYQFLMPTYLFEDYPKIGVWPDAYYMTANEFGPRYWEGAGVFAFDRTSMLAGATATFLYQHLGRPNYGLLPSDVENSSAAPPAGEPGHFLEYRDTYNQHALWMYDFDVDFATPANSTLTGPVHLPVDAFRHHVCKPVTRCIPQKGTTRLLDSLADVLMYPLEYYNYGAYEDMVVTHTVKAGKASNTGIRWYQLRSTGGGAWSVYQQGTYAPNALYRWMPSAALDASGNLAVGYSVSSARQYPSIRYAGRLATDPLGELSQGEAIIIAGRGSQTGTNRWGDYSAMQIDPSDGCTFWYTNEYYSRSSSADWQTRIASFRYPSCI